MNFQPKLLYHIYNRGNNRQQLFYSREHYLVFLSKIRKILLEYCELLAYCLMPNHYHLMVCTHEILEGHEFRIPFKKDILYHPLVRKIGTLQSSYTRILNNEMQRTGSLFQQKAKSKLLNEDPDYPIICFHYLHRNPALADLIKLIYQWEFSSYLDYAGYRNDDLVNKKLAAELLGIPLDPIKFQKESGLYMLNDTSVIF